MKHQLRRLANAVLRRRPHPVILMYHRISDEAHDPLRIAVSPALFDEHLAVLKRDWNVLPLPELARLHRLGELSGCSVAITFDDGYTCALNAAAPLLEKHGLPATFFLTTGALDSEREYWWDEITTLIFGSFPDGAHSIAVGGRTIEFELEKSPPADTNWTIYDAAKTPRQNAFKMLARALQESAFTEQQSMLDALWAKSGRARPRARATHRPMTSTEAVALSRRKGAEIGAHTITHTMLGKQPPQIQKSEIEGSKSVCDALFKQSTRSFAYAYGSYNQSAVELVRLAGFETACGTEEKPVRADLDIMAMPRMAVQNQTGKTFAHSIERLSMR